MEVVTFPTKIQKSEGNSTTLKNWIPELEGNLLPWKIEFKNWMVKNMITGNSTFLEDYFIN